MLTISTQKSFDNTTDPFFKGKFGSMIVIAFYLKIYQNNVFLFLKNYF